jgi:hypothetical protein
LLSSTEVSNTPILIQYTHPFLGEIISDSWHEINVYLRSALESHLIKSKTAAMNSKLQKSRLLFPNELEKSIWYATSYKPTAVGYYLSVTELYSEYTDIFK